MAVDSCSTHKLGLIGGEMSLTLTAAARPTSIAACHLKWHCCNFRQQQANTLSINYMVECALAQQTHTVNTYVSCRSSLHSNPQHSNTCLLRSTSPEVDCFHGNQAAAFDDGSHEMTPADNAGSSESPRGRMDGWMGGWVVLVGKLWRKRKRRTIISHRNWVTYTNRTARLAFPAGAVYLAPRQTATGTPCTRWGGDVSQPHQGWHDSHTSCWFMYHKKNKFKKSAIKCLCLGCEGKRNVSREVHAPPSAALFYLLLQTDKCECVRILSPLSFVFRPLTLQSLGEGNITHSFHCNSYVSASECSSLTFPSYQSADHVWEILLHQEQTVCG